jgi:hypothetical protein
LLSDARIGARSPRRLTADAGDAELGGELEMFLDLIAIHAAVRALWSG